MAEVIALNSYGLTAGALRYFHFMEVVNQALEPEHRAKLDPGGVSAAMLLQLTDPFQPGLLYLSEFLRRLRIEYLLGVSYTNTALTYQVQTKCLEQIASYGPERLYTALKKQVAAQLKELGLTSSFKRSDLLDGSDYSATLREVWPPLQLDEGFTESPEYCHALCGLLACAQLITTAAQRLLRQRCQEQQIVVPNPDRSPGSKLGPTWQRICFLFTCASISIYLDDELQTELVNMSPLERKIVQALGAPWSQIYDPRAIRQFGFELSAV